jgi:hypothetical protein
MWKRSTFVFVACLAAGSAVLGDELQVVAAYANVEVLSIDPSTRLIVIKNSEGRQETFELDATVAGMSGLKVGDRAVLTVRGEPGRMRVSAIAKAAKATSPEVRPRPSTTRTRGDEDRASVAARDRFTSQVEALSRQAQSIDVQWASFVTSCGVSEMPAVEGSRAWFGIWDSRVKADLSTGFCRDLFNQIVAAGEAVKREMTAAEDDARRHLDAGNIREIRARHSMDWEGWTLPAPARLSP